MFSAHETTKKTYINRVLGRLRLRESQVDEGRTQKAGARKGRRRATTVSNRSLIFNCPTFWKYVIWKIAKKIIFMCEKHRSHRKYF